MAGPDWKDLLNLQEVTNKQKEIEQKQYENIMKKLVESPENLNKVDKKMMEWLDNYMQWNKDFATAMLLNCMEWIKKLWDEKLSNIKDKNSLNGIKELCLKRTTMEDVWALQLKKEILTNDFTDAKLIELWKTYFNEWQWHWFSNIPVDYKVWSNAKIKSACEGKYFTENQLVQTLYEKNNERRNKVISAFNNLNITDFIPKDKTDTKGIMEEIKDWRPTSKWVWTDILENIIRISPIDWYWEYQDILPQFIGKWEKKIDEHFHKQQYNEMIEEEKIMKEEIGKLTKQNVVDKIPDTNIKEYYNSPNNKLDDVLILIKSNSTSEKAQGLYALLKEWKIKEFQKKVYNDNFTRSKYLADWKIGEETLGKTKEYLASTEENKNETVQLNINTLNKNLRIYDSLLILFQILKIINY